MIQVSSGMSWFWSLDFLPTGHTHQLRPFRRKARTPIPLSIVQSSAVSNAKRRARRGHHNFTVDPSTLREYRYPTSAVVEVTNSHARDPWPQVRPIIMPLTLDECKSPYQQTTKIQKQLETVGLTAKRVPTPQLFSYHSSRFAPSRNPLNVSTMTLSICPDTLGSGCRNGDSGGDRSLSTNERRSLTRHKGPRHSRSFVLPLYTQREESIYLPSRLILSTETLRRLNHTYQDFVIYQGYGKGEELTGKQGIHGRGRGLGFSM